MTAAKSADKDEAFWQTDTPTTAEEALRLLRFGAVMTPLGEEHPVDQLRTERRMLACANFFEKAVPELGTNVPTAGTPRTDQV